MTQPGATPVSLTPVFLTVDTEFAWRHHRAGLPLADIYDRSVEPAGVGIGYQLARFAEHRLNATFFVDPMPALAWGLEPVARMVDAVLSAGQEVQLHLHPNWIGARAHDRTASGPRGDLALFDVYEQRDLLRGAIDLLVAAGAPRPVAFRAGSYAANDDTLAALADLGLRYDSSHNGAAPAQSRVSLPPARVSPTRHVGITEVPVTVIEDAPGSLRTAQVCALSRAEMRDLLDHAAAERHAAVTLVSHGFELANRAGTRPNRVHVRRFDALCRMLAERRERLPTTRFDSLPDLALDRDDRPLGPDPLRTNWRRAEQLWSNLVEERAA